MESLRAQGDAISFARNHNGKYGNFDDEVKRYGHLEVSPFTPAGLVARKYMFDDSPVYDDHAVLDQWWAARQKSGAKRAVLYYNTVSLHDGSHWTADKDWWKKDHREMYREFLTGLLEELSKFFQLVSSSGRNTVVIVLGEHGRAVRGSAMETPGLRDIPLPRVTIVPVGIKLFGKGYRDVQSGRNITISKPASYFALSYMLEAFTERSPFQSDIYASRNFIDSIPQTFYVSENQDNVIVKKDDGYYLFGKDKKWTQLTEKELQ
jgi:cellulose synthase operon protein YhjU